MKKIVLTVLLTALVISVCGCAVTVNPDDYAFRSGNVYASIIPDIIKIHRDEEIPKTVDKVMRFGIGINDLGSSQFIFSNYESGIKSVKTCVGYFVSDSVKTLPDGCVTVYKEYFHPIITLSPTVYYPDGLIPMEGINLTVDVEKDQNCALWVDAEVPFGTEPDIYKGSVCVTFDGGEFVVPVEIDVLDVEIPLVPTLNTYAAIFNDVAYQYEGVSEEESERLTEQVRQGILKSRLNPQRFVKTRNSFSTPEEYADYVADQFEADPRVTNHLLRFKSLDDLVQICDRLRERGVLNKCYIYPFDEPTQDQIEKINAYLDNINALIPDLKTLICMNSWHPDLLGHLNFWCVNTPIASDALKREQIRNTGSEVWRYGSLKLQIAQTSAAYPIAYYSQLKDWDIDGMLIWSVYNSQTFDSLTNVYTSETRDMWNYVYCYTPIEWWDPYGGGATYFYTGKEDDGIVNRNLICESVRLRYLRQAAEYYELLTIREKQLTTAAKDLGIISESQLKDLMDEYYSNAQNAFWEKNTVTLNSDIFFAYYDVIKTLYTDILSFNPNDPLIATVMSEDETLFAQRDVTVYAAPGSEVLVNGKKAEETGFNEKLSLFTLTVACPDMSQTLRVSVNGEIFERRIYAESVDKGKYYSIFADGGISQKDYEAVLSKSPETVIGYKNGTIELDLSDPATKAKFVISSLGNVQTSDLKGATHIAITLTNRESKFISGISVSVETSLYKVEIPLNKILDPGLTTTVYVPLDSFYERGQNITKIARLTLHSASDTVTDMKIAISDIAFVTVG